MNNEQPTMEKESPPAFVFEGFEPANTTPVPDVLFDELLTELSGTELKVLLYIIRRTLGFKKTSDGISLTQFTDGITTKDKRVLDKGCGIKKRSTVSQVLRSLIAKGCVESEKGKTDLGDDAVTVYRVHFKGVVAKSSLPSPQTATTVVPKQTLPGGAQTATTGSADLATHKKQLARNSRQETGLQESTYRDNPETAAIGTNVPSPAPSSSQESHIANDTPTQGELSGLHQHLVGSTVRDDVHLPGSNPQGTAGDPHRTTPAQQQKTVASAPEQAAGYRQATSQGSQPRQSAKQAPMFTPAPLFASTKPARPTLTTEGKLVRDWYQVIRACRVRLTDDNINACNGLSEEDGISFESLKEAIEYWDEDKYVKDHEIAIDLQKLEDPKGAFTFAKAMLILRKRKKPASTAPKPEMTAIEKLRAESLRYAQRGIQA